MKPLLLVAAIGALSLAAAPLPAFQGALPAPAPAAEPRLPIGAQGWSLLDRLPDAVLSAEAWIRPARGQALAFDRAAMQAVLVGAPLEGSPAAIAPGGRLVLSLPDPTGQWRRFAVVESPVMAPALAAQLPEVKTYLGQGLDDPAAAVRFDLTPQGFHAMVIAPRRTSIGAAGQPIVAAGTWFIDPVSRGDSTHHMAYYKRDLANPHAPFWNCSAGDDDLDAPAGLEVPARSGTVLHTYRAAISCTSEYSSFHGGTVALAQAAIVTAINRINSVYEREFSIRLILIPNNTSLIYLSSAPDPYTDGVPATLINESQANIDSVIGSANYDIGHTLNTGGGGLAGLGVVCRAGNKARGVTGLPQPTGDGFYIDYVCHEMGHQFGAAHTFNGTGGSCAANRSGASAYEPGSGSTIMGYTGVCAADDLQRDAEVMFHSRSFDQVLAYVTTGGGAGCAQNSSTGNLAPVLATPINRTIPSRTPFILSGSATDPNGDALTYSWEERDLGPAAALSADDDGLIPLVRTDAPVDSPVRVVPSVLRLIFGLADPQERLPQLGRTMRWRLTARDNRAGGGGVNTADLTLTVAGAAGPFQITSQNAPVAWPATTQQTITWDVAGTNASGINCASVNILLSTDGANSFPVALASNIPNSGSAVVTVPFVPTINGHIKVEAVGNIFFDVNNAPITITGAPPAAPTNVLATPNPGCAGGFIQLSATPADPSHQVQWYTGACAQSLVGFGSPINVLLPAGGQTYYCRVRDPASGASSPCVTLVVGASAAPADPVSASTSRAAVCAGDPGTITLALSGGSGSTARWFAGSCSGPGAVLVGIGNPISIPAPAASTTYFGRWETSCAASACASTAVSVSSSADFNADGVVDPDDLSDFIGCFFAASPCPAADFNADGVVDPDDLSDFIGRFFGAGSGC